MQQIDVSILLWIQENLRNDVLTAFWRLITFLGDGGWFWIALGLVLVILPKYRPVGGTMLLALLIGALITNVALKNLVARIRPYDYTSAIVPLIALPTDYSFPSGHSCASFAGAFVCLRMMPTGFGIAAMVLAALISFSRLYVGVHYPTDVLAGIVIGIFAAQMAYLIVTRLILKRKKEEPVNS